MTTTTPTRASNQARREAVQAAQRELRAQQRALTEAWDRTVAELRAINAEAAAIVAAEQEGAGHAV